MTRSAVIVACLALSACDPIPQDPAGTSERIEASGRLHLGVVAGTEMSEEARRLIAAVAKRHSARIVMEHRPASHLMRQLQDGTIDLVIGEFGRSGPASKDVSLSPAIGVPEPKSGTEPVLRLARRHGENRLILLTDRLASR